MITALISTATTRATAYASFTHSPPSSSPLPSFLSLTLSSALILVDTSTTVATSISNTTLTTIGTTTSSTQQPASSSSLSDQNGSVSLAKSASIVLPIVFVMFVILLFGSCGCFNLCCGSPGQEGLCSSHGPCGFFAVRRLFLKICWKFQDLAFTLKWRKEDFGRWVGRKRFDFTMWWGGMVLKVILWLSTTPGRRRVLSILMWLGLARLSASDKREYRRRELEYEMYP